MAKQTDNLLFFDASTGQTTVLGADHSVAISGDFEVGGNLTVLGTMSYIDAEVLTSDAYLLMNSAYTGTTTKNGGFVLNSKMESLPGNLISVDAVTNTVVISGVHALVDGDVFALIATSDSRNDSLFEVGSATNNGVNTTVVLKATVSTGFSELLRSSSLLVDEGATSGAKGGLVKIAVLRSDSDANRFEYGFGTNALNMVFEDIAASSLNLQTAYDNGNTIGLTSGNSLQIGPASGQSAGFNISGNASSSIAATGLAPLSISANGGLMTLSNTNNSIRATVPIQYHVKLLSGASEGASDTFGRLLIDGEDVSLTSNGFGGSMTIESGSGVTVKTTGGASSNVLNLLAQNAGGKVVATAQENVEITSSTTNVIVGARNSVSITADRGNYSGSNGDVTVTAKGGDLLLRSIGDIAGTKGTVTISSAATGALTGLSITALAKMATSVTNGAYEVTTVNGGTQSPINLTSADAMSLIAGGNVTLSSNDSAADLLISTVAGTGSSATITTDDLALNSDNFAITSTGTTVGSSITSGHDLTLSVPTGNTALMGSGDSATDTEYSSISVSGNEISIASTGASASRVDIDTKTFDVNADTGTATLSGGTTTVKSTSAGLTMIGKTGLDVYTVNGPAAFSGNGDTVLAAYGTTTTASTLTIKTDKSAGNDEPGALNINARNVANFTAGGALSIGSTDGALTISATNAGTNSPLTISTSADALSVTSGATLNLGSSSTSGLVNISTAGAGAGNGVVSVSTKTLQMQAVNTSVGGTDSILLGTTSAGSSLTLNAGGANSVMSLASDTSTTITSGRVKVKADNVNEPNQFTVENSDSAKSIEVVKSTGFTGVRVGQAAVLGAPLSAVSKLSDVGVGARVTFEADVNAGEILAVTSAGTFDKALARLALAGDSELPQNPLGIAGENGKIGVLLADAFMSTVHGATVLVQLQTVPNSVDVGKAVYLSPTSAGKGVIPSQPSDLINGDGLTRVTMVGYLLSSTPITVAGLTGNVSVYPMLWLTDHVVDG